jgi:hypothetical protein
VSHTSRVLPGDRVSRVVANRDGPLTASSARARNIESGYVAIVSKQEPVVHPACVNEGSSDGRRDIVSPLGKLSYP